MAMSSRYVEAVLCAACCLAGCGASPAPDEAHAAQAARHELAQAQRAGSASRTLDPAAFLDWAEATFPSFFSGHPADARVGTVAYRAYSANGNYLGVDTASDTVLVLGTLTGNTVVSLGPTSRFACLAADCSTSARAIFDKPFAGEYPAVNFVDHNVPKEFVDTNEEFLPFWGESLPTQDNFTAGHSGYDFQMPVGTPIFAVADGTVDQVLDPAPPFFCPPLGRNATDQKQVNLGHVLPDATRVRSVYMHLSRIDVRQGERVRSGQQIGLSGDTGCTTGGFLHFETRVLKGTAYVTIDPYGWWGPAPDPWELAADGAASIPLWKPGRAPKLWREVAFPVPNSLHAGSAVTVGRVVYHGVADAFASNNEFVELALNDGATSASLDGYRVRLARSGITYALPSGMRLDAARPLVRIYLGQGTNTADSAYAALGAAFSHTSRGGGDCVFLISPSGRRDGFAMAPGACS